MKRDQWVALPHHGLDRATPGLLLIPLQEQHTWIRLGGLEVGLLRQRIK
ncbi:MAG: hypothetical protein IPL49_18225 [Saprospirales bacterium]|nr:hypothetical protein [Saprospirales bacterium]